MFISGIIVRMDTQLEGFMVKLSIDALRTENGRQKYPLFALKLSKTRIMVRYYTTAKHFLKFELHYFYLFRIKQNFSLQTRLIKSCAHPIIRYPTQILKESMVG